MNVMQWEVYVTEMTLGHIYAKYSIWIIAGLQASTILAAA
jgi:hypothetical protein